MPQVPNRAVSVETAVEVDVEAEVSFAALDDVSAAGLQAASRNTQAELSRIFFKTISPRIFYELWGRD